MLPREEEVGAEITACSGPFVVHQRAVGDDSMDVHSSFFIFGLDRWSCWTAGWYWKDLGWLG